MNQERNSLSGSFGVFDLPRIIWTQMLSPEMHQVMANRSGACGCVAYLFHLSWLFTGAVTSRPTELL